MTSFSFSLNKLKCCFVIVMFSIVILYPRVVLAQEDKPFPLQFHGSNTFFGQYSDMQGLYQEIPPSFYRNHLKMTLTVYDIPISASFFITSEQGDYRQSANSFSINFSARELLKNKGIANSTDIITSVALSSLNKLKNEQDALEKSKNLLNTDVNNLQTSLEMLKRNYEKAKKELIESKLHKSKEKVEQAKAKLAKAKLKLDKAQDKYDKAKAKLAKAKEKIKTTMAKLEKAIAKVEEVKSLKFDSNTAKRLADAKVKKSVMSRFTRFLANFSTLEVGKCRPNYSELMLRGIAVSGVNIEFTPGLFYSAFCTGKTKRPIINNSFSLPVYEQKLYFGKLGLGKKQGTHFYLSYMQAEDDVNSLPIQLGPDTNFVTPRSNYVVGSELMLAFFKRKFTIEGEGAISMLTRDKRCAAIEWNDESIPVWLTDYFKPNMSSSIDYAYNAKSCLNLETTKISIGIKKIGAGFTSLGNPSLIRDRLSYDGTIDQSFAKKKIHFLAYYKESSDNLINWKTSATKMHAYGISAMFRFKKVPYLRLSYMPNFQSMGSNSIKVENAVTHISAISGYNYRIGKLRSNTIFNFSSQYIKTTVDTIKIANKIMTYTLTEELTFKIPLSISAGLSYSNCELSAIKREIFSYNISATHSAFKRKWQNRVGVKYAEQLYQQYKIGFYWYSKLKVLKNNYLSIRLEKNIFEEYIMTNNSFDEFIAQISLEIRW